MLFPHFPTHASFIIGQYLSPSCKYFSLTLTLPLVRNMRIQKVGGITNAKSYVFSVYMIALFHIVFLSENFLGGLLEWRD